VYQVPSVPDYEIPISELEFKRPIGKVPSFRKLSFGGDFYVGQGRKFCTGIWDLCLLSTWAEDHLHASFGMITKFDKLPSVS
jgi:hypothetical protein